jgi:chromate transporter
MPSDSSPAAASAPAPPKSAPPSLIALFLAFAKMSVAGFGGVLYWARRAIVDQHRWMSADEFNQTYALCHFLPGPNIVNLSMVFGARLRGIAGGIAAFTGLLVPPMLIMTVLAAIYARYGELDALRRTLAGVSCAAVGLLIANVLRMMAPLVRRRDLAGLVMLAIVFVTIGLVRWPMPAVLLAAIPVSIAVTFAVLHKGSA